jgi:hypothetical protein
MMFEQCLTPARHSVFLFLTNWSGEGVPSGD